jgi:hypothetical protein
MTPNELSPARHRHAALTLLAAAVALLAGTAAAAPEAARAPAGGAAAPAAAPPSAPDAAPAAPDAATAAQDAPPAAPYAPLVAPDARPPGLAASAASAAAAEPPARRTASGTSTLPDPVPGVTPLLAPLDAPLATASVGAGGDGATVRGAVVPGRAFDAYVPLVSELRLAVSGETATGVTRVVLGTALDPFAPESPRGAAVLSVAGCSTREMEQRRWAVASAATLEERTRLERDMSAIVVEEARDDAAEVALQVEQALAERARGAPNADAALARVLERSRMAVKRLIDARNLLEHLKTQAATAKGAREIAAEAVKADDDGRAACEDRAIAAAWPRLHGTWLPRVALSGAVDLLPGRTGRDGAPAGREAFGGWRAELALQLRPHEGWTLEAWAAGASTRPSGVVGTPLGWSYGGGVTASALWWTFLRGDRAASPDYLREGFLPGVAGGVSGQVLRCDTACAGGVTEAWSATPFLDVRVRPALQFRFAVPVTRSSEGPVRATTVAPTVTVAAALAGR